MATLIDCCNSALAEVAAGSISSLDDGTLEARECKRFAARLVAEVSGWHEWGFLVVTVRLAETPNDRPHEWDHAYAEPSDMEKPMLVLRGEHDESLGELIPGSGNAYTPVRHRHHRPERGDFSFPAQAAEPIAFLHEGGKIYTNAPRALLRHWRVLTDVGQFPPALARAFELELAARIALPLRKDASLAGSLKQQAEVQKSRAAADDFNRHPRPPVRYTSAADLARRGESDLS